MRQGFVYGGLCVLVGIGMIVLGGAGLASGVTCHGHELAQGEKCFSIERRIGPVLRDHDEEAAAQTRQNWLLLGFGVPMTIGGGLWFASSVRGRRGRTP